MLLEMNNTMEKNVRTLIIKEREITCIRVPAPQRYRHFGTDNNNHSIWCIVGVVCLYVDVSSISPVVINKILNN